MGVDEAQRCPRERGGFLLDRGACPIAQVARKVKRLDSGRVPELTPSERRALADVIRQLRARERLSQQEVADRVGLGRNYLSDVESGRRRPSWDGVVLIARGLGVPLPELVRMYEERVRSS